MNNSIVTITEIEFAIIEANEAGIRPTIETNAETAFYVFTEMKNCKYELVIAGDSIKHTAKQLDKILFVLRHANHPNTAEQACSQLAALLAIKSVKEGIESVASLIEYNKCSDVVESFMSKTCVSFVTSLIETIIASKKNDVAHYLSVSDEAIHMDLDEELIDMIKNSQNTIFVITHGMGQGKTEKVTKRLFNDYSTEMRAPIGIAPKKILASAIISDARNYKNVNQDSIVEEGVFGVINSVVGNPLFSQYRKQCELLIAEEHEEIIAQATGRAVKDGSLIDRSKLLAGYFELINSTDTVVLIDALFSQESLNMIKAHTNKNIVVVKEKTASDKKVTVRVMTEGESVAVAAETMMRGGNVLSFSDAKNKGDKSKFSEIFHSIAQSNESSQMITANTLAEEKNEVEYIKNIQNVIASKQFTMCSPVINSGVSITNGHADSVHVFFNQTVSLKSAIQTIKRDRVAEVVNISVSPNFSTLATSNNVIIASELMKDVKEGEISGELYDSYLANTAVQSVATVISKDNAIKLDYEMNLIIALEMIGFNVEFYSSQNAKDLGTALKEAGREVEESERVQALLNAEKISDEEAKSLMTSENVTNKGRYEIARYEIESTYLGDISEELIAFDKKGENRKKIENNLIAAGFATARNFECKFKKQIIDLLFSTLSIDANSTTGQFTSVNAEEFVSKINNEVFDINGVQIKGSDAFKIAFKMPLPKGHAATVVSKVLSSKFGIKTESAGQATVEGKRVRKYSVTRDLMNEALASKLTEVLERHASK